MHVEFQTEITWESTPRGRLEAFSPPDSEGPGLAEGGLPGLAGLSCDVSAGGGRPPGESAEVKPAPESPLRGAGLLSCTLACFAAVKKTLRKTHRVSHQDYIIVAPTSMPSLTGRPECAAAKSQRGSKGKQVLGNIWSTQMQHAKPWKP